MSDNLHITLLKENSAACPGVAPGHGLALLVEVGEIRVLFDAGPDATVLTNAEALGVNLEPLDAIVLSHGHSDHTGGLEAVLKQVGPARVIAHTGIFDETYSRGDEGGTRYIGTPHSYEHYRARGAMFEFSELPVDLGGGIMSTGHIPQIRPTQRMASHLLRRGQSGLMRDDFRDDVSLIVRRANCSVVITGCAHAGLPNILYKAQTIIPNHPPQVVLGGLHLDAVEAEEIAKLAAEAYSLGVRTLLPCHCTGERGVICLQDRFPGNVSPISTGSVITVSPHGKVTSRSKLS